MNLQAFAIKLTTVLTLLLVAIGVAQAAGVGDGFNPDANGLIWTIEQQRNGQLLLGGQFSTIGGATRHYVARVNNDGGRSSFNPDVSGGTASSVRALHEQPDGSILIGGRFNTVSGQPRSNIARVSSTGALDTGFDPGTDDIVQAFASQLAPDGLSGVIYVVGKFDTVDGVVRHGIARLHADGSIDTSFVPPEFDGSVNAVKLQLDGRILVAGYFSRIDGVDIDAPIARLNADGSLDTSFSTTVSDFGGPPFIGELAVQPDGMILIVGTFDTVGGQARTSIARLHADGQLDSGFEAPSFNASISSMVLQSDGRIMVTGGFSNDITRRGVARLNADGSFDSSFTTSVTGTVYAIAQQADGKYAIGGAFTHVDTVARNRIARLEANGAPDVDFIADVSNGPDSRANVLALQTDGKALVGGQANSNGNSRLTRLLGNGLPDPDFESYVNGDVSSLIAYPDGTILAAGSSATSASALLVCSMTAPSTNFTATPDNNVNATALQRNGRILVGGTFSNVGGLTHNTWPDCSTTAPSNQDSVRP